MAHFHAPSLGSLRDARGDFARRFVENVFEALDTPGEGYLDRAAGRLHYLPDRRGWISARVDASDGSRAAVRVRVRQSIIDACGVVQPPFHPSASGLSSSDQTCATQSPGWRSNTIPQR